ncbi:MAG: hypothetical protein ACOCSQ_05840, partial [Planctomycetota bacterium]
MHNWRDLLNEKGLLVADGAWGTEFVKRGLDPGEAPELWNIQRPDDVVEVAAGYVAACSRSIRSSSMLRYLLPSHS